MAEPARSGVHFGEADYRESAWERLGEAYTLLRNEQFAGSVYLAGRGVEAMLRAVIWKNDPDIRQGKKSLETGHNLRQLLTRVRDMGLLREGGREDAFATNVQTVARLWFNNMRFASNRFPAGLWRDLGETNSRRTLKKASAEYYDACSAIIKRCEVLCRH